MFDPAARGESGWGGKGERHAGFEVEETSGQQRRLRIHSVRTLSGSRADSLERVSQEEKLCQSVEQLCQATKSPGV